MGGRRGEALDAESASHLSRFQANVLSWDYWGLRAGRKPAALRPVPPRFSSFKARRGRRRRQPPRRTEPLPRPAGLAAAQPPRRAEPPAAAARRSRRRASPLTRAQEYVDVFEPLILEECRAQVLRGEARSALRRRRRRCSRARRRTTSRPSTSPC